MIEPFMKIAGTVAFLFVISSTLLVALNLRDEYEQPTTDKSVREMIVLRAKWAIAFAVIGIMISFVVLVYRVIEISNGA
jgi:heme/copper-type cytochrome/quinol oxidase subunit 2